MELQDRAVVMYLTAGGFEDLNFLVGLDDDLTGLTGLVVESDTFGLWMSLAGESQERILGVPWLYIRAIRVEPAGESEKETRKSIGFA
jgi:hypothetical protein